MQKRQHRAVLCHLPNAVDGCSFYRGVVPLADLKRRLPDVAFQFQDQITWAAASFADLVYMQRPKTQQDLQAALDIKTQGKVLWIDWDDLIPALSPDNPVYEGNLIAGAADIVKEVAALADIFTCSTQRIADYYQPLTKRIQVLPNALPMNVLGPRMVPEAPTKLAMWRGGQSHRYDVTFFNREIDDIIEMHQEWAFGFLGMAPWMLKEQPNMRKKGMIPAPQMFSLLKGVKPDLMHVPLWDSPFNQAKSNIAALEALWAGALPIVPNWAEWQIPGVMHYEPGNRQSFRETFREAIKMENYKRIERVEQGWSWVQEHRLLEKVNGDREAIIREFLNIPGEGQQDGQVIKEG